MHHALRKKCQMASENGSNTLIARRKFITRARRQLWLLRSSDLPSFASDTPSLHNAQIHVPTSVQGTARRKTLHQPDQRRERRLLVIDSCNLPPSSLLSWPGVASASFSSSMGVSTPRSIEPWETLAAIQYVDKQTKPSLVLLLSHLPFRLHTSQIPDPRSRRARFHCLHLLAVPLLAQPTSDTDPLVQTW